MNARVRATSWLGGDRVRATVNMLVERDGHLRFEAEVSLQGTVATLATDGTTFALLDAHKNELSRGPACPANVASLIRIPLGARRRRGGAARRRAPARRRSTPATSTVGWDARRGADVLAMRDARRRDAAVLSAAHGAARDAGRGRSHRRGRRAAVADRLRGSRDRRRRAAARARSASPSSNGSFDDGVEICSRIARSTSPPGRRVHARPPGRRAIIDVGCAN